MNACTDPTLYAVTGIYTASGTYNITVPDCINHIDFNNSYFPNGTPQMVLTVAGSSSTPLIIESCPYGNCQFVHTGSRTLVLKDMTCTTNASVSCYTSQLGTGTLFLEDVGFGNFPTLYNTVYARQLNIEEPTTTPKFTCHGCKLWVLGYKTEHNSTSIISEAGGQVEIFGGFFFNLTTNPPAGSAIAQLTNSSLFMAAVKNDVVIGGSVTMGMPNWVNETQTASSGSLVNAGSAGPSNLNMFYSYGAGAPAATNFILGQGTIQFQGKIIMQ